MARPDVVRGAPVELSIVHVDVEIGQKRPLGRHARDPFQREIEVCVRRMRLVAHRIHDHRLDALEEPESFLRQCHNVVGIGDAAKPEAERGNEAVALRDRHHGDPGCRELAFDQFWPIDRVVEPVPFSLEAVAEAALDDRVGPPVRPGLDRALPAGIGAQVVDAVQLVGMVVRPDHGVDPLDTCVNQLLAQVGRGVDQDGFALVLDEDGTAAAAVAAVLRVGGTPFGSALAARPGDARRDTAAQDGYAHSWRSASARFALVNSRKKLSVVADSSSAMPTPLSSATLAAVWATKAGSLVLPRFGTGAR